MTRFNVDVIAFDLDGTLIDSKRDIAESLNLTFNEVGYASLSMETISSYVGNGIVPLVQKAVAKAGHPEREQEVLELFRSIYWERLLIHTKLYPGVMDTLETFSEKYGMGVVSNKPERYTKEIVKRLGLEPMFGDQVYGGDSLPVKKPDPAALLKVAEKHGASPSRLLFVGDGSVDVMAGKNAGAYTVGVTYGFRSVEELEKAGVDRLIDNFDELLQVVEKK